MFSTNRPRAGPSVAILLLVLVLVLLLLLLQSLQKIEEDLVDNDEKKAGNWHGEKKKADSSDESYFYYNLSCPLEWSKFSCVYQGHTERAQTSLNQPLQHKDAIARVFRAGLPPRSRVLLVGDSTMRQIAIALGCIAMSIDPTVEYMADWQPSWPCSGASNCVHGGGHSGFSRLSLKFPKQGSSLHFVALGGSNFIHEEPDIVKRFKKEVATVGQITFGSNTAFPIDEKDSYLNSTDTLIINIGLHNSLKGVRPLLEEFITFADSLRKQEKRPKLVYITTVTQHFNTSNGQYSKQQLLSGGVGTCLERLHQNPRARIEQEMVTGHVDRLVDYNDVELGACHVGGQDCTHYCMPGPPDWMAARLLQVLQQLQS